MNKSCRKYNISLHLYLVESLHLYLVKYLDMCTFFPAHWYTLHFYTSGHFVVFFLVGVDHHQLSQAALLTKKRYHALVLAYSHHLVNLPCIYVNHINDLWWHTISPMMTEVDCKQVWIGEDWEKEGITTLPSKQQQQQQITVDQMQIKFSWKWPHWRMEEGAQYLLPPPLHTHTHVALWLGTVSMSMWFSAVITLAINKLHHNMANSHRERTEKKMFQQVDFHEKKKKGQEQHMNTGTKRSA